MMNNFRKTDLSGIWIAEEVRRKIRSSVDRDMIAYFLYRGNLEGDSWKFNQADIAKQLMLDRLSVRKRLKVYQKNDIIEFVGTMRVHGGEVVQYRLKKAELLTHYGLDPDGPGMKTYFEQPGRKIASAAAKNIHSRSESSPALRIGIASTISSEKKQIKEAEDNSSAEHTSFSNSNEIHPSTQQVADLPTGAAGAPPSAELSKSSYAERKARETANQLATMKMIRQQRQRSSGAYNAFQTT